MTLSAHGISFAYTPGRPVLREVSLSFPAGSVTAVVGPNGAGKSTLLRILAGLLPPGAGSVALGSAPISRLSHHRRSRLLAYIPQRPALAFAFTVRQVVALGRYAAPQRASAADDALALVGLSDRADEPFLNLSAGQQQRAAIARSLAQLDLHRPGPSAALALLADEPTSAMDPLHALRTMDLLRAAAARGPAIILILHDLTLAARSADRAVVLSDRGTVLAQGAAAEVLSPSILSPAFAVDFRRLSEPGSGAVAIVPVGPAPRVESPR